MTAGGEIATRCRDFVAANDFAAAEQAIAELSAIDGCLAEAGFLKGMLHFRQGDYSAAAAAVDESLGLNDNSIEAMELKLRILSMQGNTAGAADLAEAVIAREPGSTGALNVCAKALAKVGRIEGAVGAWWRIASMVASDPAPLMSIAVTYFKAKAYPEAYDAAMAAFGREKSVRAMEIAADSAAKAKDPEKLAVAAIGLAGLDGAAAQKYMRFLMTPDHVPAAARLVLASGLDAADAQEVAAVVTQLVKRARGAEKAGDDAAAAESWGLVLQLEPEHAKASSSLRRFISGLMKSGIAALEGNENLEAIAIFQKLVAYDPNVGTAWRKLAMALSRESMFAEEAEAWRNLAKLTGDADAWQRSLRAARKVEPSECQLRLFVEARGHLEAESSMKEKGDSLARKLGKAAFQQAGEVPFSVTYDTLQAINSWDAENPIAEKLRTRLVSVLLRVVRSNEAEDEDRIAAAEKLLAVEPANLVALQLLSKTYFKNRRFEDASSVYEKLIELNPEEKTYWHYLSRCRKALKKPEMSVDFATRQAGLYPNGEADAFLQEVAA